MARKRYKPDEIVAKLLQVDVLGFAGPGGGRRGAAFPEGPLATRGMSHASRAA